MAKDGLDYVETWVALKSAAGAKKVEKDVDDPKRFRRRSGGVVATDEEEDARAPEEEAPGPPRPHVRVSGYEAARQAAESCAVFRVAPR